MVCVFCKQKTPEVTFASTEHIVPESLGNDIDELILPPGAVCDQCNNGRLALLDQTLLEFPLIKSARVIGKIKNKNKSHPVLKSANNISMQSDSKVLHTTMDNRKKHLKPIVYDNGSVQIKFALSGNQITTKKASVLARSLLKIAFEVAVKQNGIDWALAQENDYLRNLILDGDSLSHGFIGIALAQSHDKCFRIKWTGFPIFIGLHNVLFTVGLVSDKESLDNIKESAVRGKYRVLLW